MGLCSALNHLNRGVGPEAYLNKILDKKHYILN